MSWFASTPLSDGSRLANSLLTPRRTNQRNDLTFVPPIDPKIVIHCDDTVVWIQLAHPNETKISQIGLSIRISFCQGRQLRQMIIAIERKSNEFLHDHVEHQPRVAQVKGRLCQDCLARKKRLGYLLRYPQSPPVMHILPPGERDQEPGIRDTRHSFENPFRVETSRGPPRTIPASRMNFFTVRSPARACSRCERIN
jgi:hypothetical protein